MMVQQREAKKMDSREGSTIAKQSPEESSAASHPSPILKRMEALFAKIFLILASLLLCVIAIELLARFYLWNVASEADFRVLASINQLKDRYGDDLFVEKIDARGSSLAAHYYLGHIPAPNFRLGENMHNAWGFRGEEFVIDKAENTFRIVALGGSSTYASDVPDYRNSYPFLLEEYLHESGFDSVEVINAGVIGYSSHQNLMNLQFRILPLQPDLVIVYQGFNDVSSRLVYPYSQYLGDNSGTVRPVLFGIFMPEIWEYSSALRILGLSLGLTTTHAATDLHLSSLPSSAHWKTYARQFNRGAYPSGIFAEVSAAEMLQNNPPVYFERNLRSLVSISASHDVHLLLVTMALDEDHDEASGRTYQRHFTSEDYVFGVAQHNELTRNIGAQLNTPVFDLAKVFPDDHTLFTDGLHMTEKGNRARAQLIGDFVIRQFSEELYAAGSSS